MRVNKLSTEEKIDILGSSPLETHSRLIELISVDENEQAALESAAADIALVNEIEQANAERELERKSKDELVFKPEIGIRAGRKFDTFELIEPIGQGAFSEVWKAYQEHDGTRRTVAVKIATSFKHMFKWEIQSLDKCFHANVISLYGFGTVDGRPYMAMPLISGKDLGEPGAYRDLTLKQRLNLFVKICEGTEHLHRNAVIHYDLKPKNILLADKTKPLIADFGLAEMQSLDEQTASGKSNAVTAGGTPGYAAPEAVDLKRVADARADVYSLGAILCKLLIGETPYTVEKQSDSEAFRSLYRPYKPSELCSHLPEGHPDLIPGAQKTLKGDLDAIVAKAMNESPEDRYQSVGDLANDVRAYLDHRCVKAQHPYPLFYRAKKFIRRRPALSAAILGLFALLVGLVVISQRLYVANNNHIAARNAAKLEAERLSEACKIVRTKFIDRFNPVENIGGAYPSVTESVHELSQALNEAGLGDSDEVLRLEHSCAAVLVELGAAEISETMIRELIEKCSDRYGEDSRHTLTAKMWLGKTMLSQGIHRLQDAQDAFMAVNKAGQAKWGGKDHRVLLAAICVARTQMLGGFLADADRFYGEAIKRSQPENPDYWQLIFDAKLGRAQANMLLKRPDQARRLAMEAIDFGQATIGFADGHPSLQLAFEVLASVEASADNLGEAISIQQDVNRAHADNYGPSSSPVWRGKFRLAIFRYQSGDHVAAKEIMAEIAGKCPIGILAMRAELELAQLDFLSNNEQSALERLDLATERIRKEFGAQHELFIYATKLRAQFGAADADKK